MKIAHDLDYTTAALTESCTDTFDWQNTTIRIFFQYSRD